MKIGWRRSKLNLISIAGMVLPGSWKSDNMDLPHQTWTVTRKIISYSNKCMKKTFKREGNYLLT